MGLGEMESALGPGASVGGAGGLSSSGAGAGAPCFLLFFLLGVGALAGASVGGAYAGAGGEDSAGGVAASGAGDGGDRTGAAVGGELTGAAVGGELTGAVTGGLETGAAAGGLETGAAAGDVETGAGDVGLVGGAAVGGVETWAAAGARTGAADGDSPPTVATTRQINARRKPVLRSIASLEREKCENFEKVLKKKQRRREIYLVKMRVKE